MPKITTSNTYRCVVCNQMRTASLYYIRKSGRAPVCVSCENDRYERFRNLYGKTLAMFLCCMSFDVPFLPHVLYENPTIFESKTPWREYNTLPRNGEGWQDKGELLGFFDGETDIHKIFGDGLTEEAFANYVRAEKNVIAKNPYGKSVYDMLLNGELGGGEIREASERFAEGTPEQREKWGTADNYTAEEYENLDRMYENRAASFKGQTITDQMDYILREVAKWQLLADKLRRACDIRGAADALKTVDNLLASECLRKKDEKPIEKSRADAMTVALEQNGFMENGALLTYDELVNAMRDKFIKSPKYDYSLDSADQMILSILNAMRRDADMEKLFTLDDDELIEDEYGEFSETESEDEKARKKYAGMTPLAKDETDGS